MSDSLKRLVFLTASQLPLFGAVLSWSNRLKEKPLTALALAGLYEVAVFAAAFGKKVWQNLEATAVSVTADWIRASLRSFAPGFRRRYKKQVIRDHGVVNFLGLGLINTYALPLEQVFVDLRIDASNPQKLNRNLVARKDLAGNHQIWDYLQKNNVGALGSAALVILGPPGCGKTTLLKHLALTLAANQQRSYGIHSATPILLSCRQHMKTITSEQPPSLGILLQEYFSDKNLFATLRPPPNWFEKRVERGKCVLLLDGMDEVADLKQREALRSWIDIQIKNYPQCRFVVTSRPQAYRITPLQRAHVLEVQPFSAGQVRKFVENWFLANEHVRTGGRVRSASRRKISQDTDALLDQLRSLSAVYDLTVNPLLLTMIAMVCDYYDALPKSRVELYQHIFKVLLGDWQKAKDIPNKYEPEDKVRVLSVFAAYLMQNRLREVSEERAIEVMSRPLAQGGITGPAVRDFIFDLQNTSGILLENEIGMVSFAHLTFQEYLTADYWRGHEDLIPELSEIIADSWWYETLRLYAGLGDATPLVKMCLDIDDVTSLMLAADCLEESPTIESGARREIEDRVLDSLESPDSNRRRIAAEVKLSRRLRHSFRRLDIERELDSRHLTCAEYQLFLDDMSVQRKFHQPDVWPGYRFGNNQAQEPIKGVRSEDAVAFCAWLTEKKGGTFRYRLPEAHELQDESSNGLVTWCQSEGFSVTNRFDAAASQILRNRSELPLVPFSQVAASLNEAQKIVLDCPTKLIARAIAFTISNNDDRDLALAFSDPEKLRLEDQLTDLLDRELERKHIEITSETLPYLINRVTDAALSKLLLGQCSLAYARHVELVLAPLSYAIYQERPDDALRLAASLRNDGNLLLSQLGALIEESLQLTASSSDPHLRSVQRAFVCKLLEFAWHGIRREDVYRRPIVRRRRYSGIFKIKSIRRLYERISNLRLATIWTNAVQPATFFGDVNRDSLQSALLNLYWWIQITSARTEGYLEMWEGIKLVREIVKS